ncbi:MAG: hypothetical protein ACREXR_00175 [Gammaproteobacteria bacterium]
MIDPADKDTQPLNLEQPKRGRGRPATGKAMTPAEKQRAYRQRQAEQRNTQVPAVTLEKVSATAEARISELESKIRELTADLELNRTQLRHWIARTEDAERELESRDGKTLWDVESRAPGRRKWDVVGGASDPYESKEKAEAFAERLRSDKSSMATGWKYRVVQVKAPK